MSRAFRSPRNFSKGIDNTIFQQLEIIAEGKSLTSTSYAKQMQTVKTYLGKAIDKVLKWKLTDQERSSVIYHARLISETNDDDRLSESIIGLLEATQRLKEND
jgi:hypothetical protein